MASYKVSAEAEEDLGRIWLRGPEEFGEAQADAYYLKFIERFELLADTPHLGTAVRGGTEFII